MAKVLERVQTTRTHWSEWLKDDCDACEVPPNIERASTPEVAWRAADVNQLIHMLDYFSIAVPRGVYAGHIRDGDYVANAASIIRKRYPKPPRKIMASLNKWLKEPA